MRRELFGAQGDLRQPPIKFHQVKASRIRAGGARPAGEPDGGARSGPAREALPRPGAADASRSVKATAPTASGNVSRFRHAAGSVQGPGGFGRLSEIVGRSSVPRFVAATGRTASSGPGGKKQPNRSFPPAEIAAFDFRMGSLRIAEALQSEPAGTRPVLSQAFGRRSYRLIFSKSVEVAIPSLRAAACLFQRQS